MVVRISSVFICSAIGDGTADPRPAGPVAALRFERHDQSPVFESLVHPFGHRQDAAGVFLDVRPGNAPHGAMAANERFGVVASRPREIAAGIPIRLGSVRGNRWRSPRAQSGCRTSRPFPWRSHPKNPVPCRRWRRSLSQSPDQLALTASSFRVFRMSTIST
jgi:hypothetical protein